MLVAIHQPEFLPYYGFISKMIHSDIFVILDDVQYERQNYQNRNNLLISGKPTLVTLPVVNTGLDTLIKDVLIDQKQFDRFRDKLLKSYTQNYHKSPFFDDVLEIILKTGGVNHTHLIDFNMSFIDEVVKYLGLPCKLIRSSTLNVNTKSTERLSDICTELNATIYLAGQGCKKYLVESEFECDIRYLTTEYLQYKQFNSESFIPNLSIIDWLCNHGRDVYTQIINSRVV